MAHSHGAIEIAKLEMDLRSRDITARDAIQILAFLERVAPAPWHFAGNEVRDRHDRTLLTVEHDNFINPVPFAEYEDATLAFICLARTLLPKLLAAWDETDFRKEAR